MDPELFEYLCGFLSERRLALFERVLARRTRRLTVVLEDLFHSHNSSACIRSCDCFGVQDVHVVESTNGFAPSNNIAAGSTNWTTVHRHQNWPDAPNDWIQHLRDEGYQLVATTLEPSSVPIAELPIAEKTALLFGNEKVGLSKAALEAADARIRIPMVGFTESFNVSVAVAITLYDLAPRIRAAENGWQLSDAEKQALRELWVQRSIGHKLQPLIRRFNQDRAST